MKLGQKIVIVLLILLVLVYIFTYKKNRNAEQELQQIKPETKQETQEAKPIKLANLVYN